MDSKEFEKILTKVLHEKRVVDDETHSVHHQYIEMEMGRREKRTKLIMKFKLSFVGGLALAVLGGLMWIGKLALEAIKIGNHS